MARGFAGLRQLHVSWYIARYALLVGLVVSQRGSRCGAVESGFQQVLTEPFSCSHDENW